MAELSQAEYKAERAQSLGNRDIMNCIGKLSPFSIADIRHSSLDKLLFYGINTFQRRRFDVQNYSRKILLCKQKQQGVVADGIIIDRSTD